MNKVIKLPLPQTELDFPLMKALAIRRTIRKWSPALLNYQQIANLLWAACGETMQATPKAKSRRTVPSARNSQCVKVYIVLHEGVFLYDESNHQLIEQINFDIREYIGNQKMMKSAPAGLIYVADFSRLKGYAGVDDNRKWFVAGTETGLISQNVYLYCASAGLNTAIIGLVNREKLHSVIGLDDSEKVVYTQVVGCAP